MAVCATRAGGSERRWCSSNCKDRTKHKSKKSVHLRGSKVHQHPGLQRFAYNLRRNLRRTSKQLGRMVQRELVTFPQLGADLANWTRQVTLIEFPQASSIAIATFGLHVPYLDSRTGTSWPSHTVRPHPGSYFCKGRGCNFWFEHPSHWSGDRTHAETFHICI